MSTWSTPAAWVARTLILLFSIFTLLPTSTHAAFVQRCGHQLCLDGKPWYFMGTNAYWLIEYVKTNHGSVDYFFDLCNQYGLKVVRLWAFNRRMPYEWGKYDENEFEGLDYIVDSAGRHGIKLILALGNSWIAYRSPQDFMQMAGIDPVDKNILDFYNSSAVRSMYRDHISAIVYRTNVFNGRRYRDDDAIMMYDAMNEPRCPGCTDMDSHVVHNTFLQNVTAHVRANAPNQLVALGTEGYFLNSHESWNPGAGARCEGEDWDAMAQWSSIDATVVHVYERQMEAVPPAWTECDFNCYCNYLIQYLSIHQRIAADANKPLILEEFGLILPKYTSQQRTVLFQIVSDNLHWNKQTGGPMMGAMFWNAAIGEVWDDGYNVYLDSAPIPPSPQSSPAVIPESSSTTSNPSHVYSRRLSSDSSSWRASPSTSTSEPVRAPIVANTETLGDFLRGPQRAACAEAAAVWWLPSWTQAWAQTVDMAAYLERCQNQNELTVLSNALITIYS